MSVSSSQHKLSRLQRTLFFLRGRSWVRRMQADFTGRTFTTAKALQAWVQEHTPPNSEIRRVLTQWAELQLPELAE